VGATPELGVGELAASRPAIQLGILIAWAQVDRFAFAQNIRHFYFVAFSENPNAVVARFE